MKKNETIGFTLIELLTVIVVIGILAGLLLPAIQSSREAAKKAAAQLTVNSLAGCLAMYVNEYGRLPNVANPPAGQTDLTLTASQNQRLSEMLSGDNCYLDSDLTPGGNPRKMAFFSFKQGERELVTGFYEVAPGANLLNPVNRWGRSIMFAFDYDGDGKVSLPSKSDNPMAPYDNATNITAQVAVWTICGKKKNSLAASWK